MKLQVKPAKLIKRYKRFLADIEFPLTEQLTEQLTGQKKNYRNNNTLRQHRGDERLR